MAHLRVLLAGAGRAGLVHGRDFAAGVSGAVLQAIADPNADARAAAGAELECDLLLDDPVAAVARDDIDAVVIAGPTFVHAELALAALAAGKHVLCEKPFVATMEEAHQVVAAVAASPASFVMAHMRRFDRRFERAMERIAAGDIGEPLMVRSTTRGPGLPPQWAWDVKRSGGLISEVNSHDIDTIRFLSGKEPERVFASGMAGKRPDLAEQYPGFIDTVTAIIELSDGAIAHFDGACPADYGYDARAEVYGTEGTILIGGPTQETAVLVRADGVVTDPVRSWRELFADAYRAEDRHFVAVARGEESPRATAEDGLINLATALAAIRSVESGTPVAVDLAEGK